MSTSTGNATLPCSFSSAFSAARSPGTRPSARVAPLATFWYWMRDSLATGRKPRIRSAKPPAMAAPEAVSASVNKAPACCVPRWLLGFGSSGIDTLEVPLPISSILIPSRRTKGKVSIICCLIRSYTMLGLTRNNNLNANDRIDMTVCLVADRLTGLHHAHDPLLRFRMVQQLQEGFTLHVEEPLLVDHAALVDVAAGDDFGDHLAQLEVVRGDEAAVAHIDQLRLDGAVAVTTGHLHRRFQRRTIAGVEHGARFDLRHVQQLIWIEDDDVVLFQVAHGLRFQCRFRHVGGGRIGEAGFQELQDVVALGFLERAHGRFLQAAAGRDQADADFDEADVGLDRGHALG